MVVDELCGRESFPMSRLGVRMASTDPGRDPEESRSGGSETDIYCPRCLTILGHIMSFFDSPLLNVMGPLQRDLSSKLK